MRFSTLSAEVLCSVWLSVSSRSRDFLRLHIVALVSRFTTTGDVYGRATDIYYNRSLRFSLAVRFFGVERVRKIRTQKISFFVQKQNAFMFTFGAAKVA